MFLDFSLPAAFLQHLISPFMHPLRLYYTLISCWFVFVHLCSFHSFVSKWIHGWMIICSLPWIFELMSYMTYMSYGFDGSKNCKIPSSVEVRRNLVSHAGYQGVLRGGRNVWGHFAAGFLAYEKNPTYFLVLFSNLNQTCVFFWLRVYSFAHFSQGGMPCHRLSRWSRWALRLSTTSWLVF